MPVTFFLYENAFASHTNAHEFEDTDEGWEEILGRELQVLPTQRDKENSFAISSVRYKEGALTRHLVNAEFSSGLVLDVDDWGTKSPYTIEELKSRLEGIRFIAWTTWSSRATRRKWRVIIPFDTPMPVAKYKALWRLFNDILDGTMSEKSTSDPTRLGFVNSVQTLDGAKEYEWHIQHGQSLNWLNVDLDEEVIAPALTEIRDLNHLPRGADWISDIEAFARAKRYFAKVGQEIEEGSRHATLLNTAMRAWWDFALPQEKVREIVALVNSNFANPKPEDEVDREVEEAYKRVCQVSQPSPFGIEREPSERASKEAILQLAKDVSKEDPKLSKHIKKAAEGEKICDPIEANTVLLQVYSRVAAEFPRERPERIYDLLQVALGATRAACKGVPNVAVPTEQELKARIQWVQNSARKNIEENVKKRQDQEQKDIERAFAYVGVSRKEPYSSQEIKFWESTANFSQARWIVSDGRNYYFWVNGHYVGPVASRDAVAKAGVLLSPAENRVKTMYLKDGIPKMRPMDELMREYGTVVGRVVRVMGVAKDCVEYSSGANTLFISAAVPVLQAEFSDRVNTWLEYFGGEEYGLLLDWLSYVPKLDKPLSMLIMGGPSGCGKTLLAQGVSRIWGPHYSNIDNYAANIDRCPVIYVNDVPYRTDFSSWVSDILDSTSHTRTIHYDQVNVYGHVRVMCSTELFDRVKVRQSLASRALTVHASQDAVTFLRTFDPNSEEFKDEIARHILWLHENWKVDDPGRYVRTNKSIFSDGENDVLAWAVRNLFKKTFSSPVILCRGEKVYINSGLLWDNWESILDGRSKPASSTVVGRLLAEMSSQRRNKIAVDGQPIRWYYQLQLESIRQYADLNGWNLAEIDAGAKELEKKAFTVA